MLKIYYRKSSSLNILTQDKTLQDAQIPFHKKWRRKIMFRLAWCCKTWMKSKLKEFSLKESPNRRLQRVLSNFELSEVIYGLSWSNQNGRAVQVQCQHWCSQNLFTPGRIMVEVTYWEATKTAPDTAPVPGFLLLPPSACAMRAQCQQHESLLASKYDIYTHGLGTTQKHRNWTPVLSSLRLDHSLAQTYAPSQPHQGHPRMSSCCTVVKYATLTVYEFIINFSNRYICLI